MSSLIRALFISCLAALLVVPVSGCAQKKVVPPEKPVPSAIVLPEEAPRAVKPQSQDCRSCHAPGTAAQSSDFSKIYDNPASHHAVGVKYPDATDFARPNGRNAEVAFFDRNGNGRPDDDEVVLFGKGDEATVECASCHREHGGSSGAVKDPASLYLRVENTGSALCITCHQR